MAWIGYYTYGGVEIINASRTETYARNAGLGWFKPVIRNEALPLLLGQKYASPMQDPAPWVDTDDPASYDFYGFYPLNISGIEDSTATATVTESTLTGGVVGRSRRGTRPVVFSGLVVAASECGTEYGMRWLTSVLSGPPCGPSTPGACIGAELHFLSCEPALDEYSQLVGTTTNYAGTEGFLANDGDWDPVAKTFIPVGC